MYSPSRNFKMNIVLLTLIEGLLLFTSFGETEAGCPPNMTATNCQPCSPICGIGAVPCALACTANPIFCQCKSGFFRIDSNSTRCVLEKDCPSANPPKCPPNEVYKTCGTCDKTCANRNPICTLECRIGCFCAQGYVRNKRNRCILPSKCNRCK